MADKSDEEFVETEEVAEEEVDEEADTTSDEGDEEAENESVSDEDAPVRNRASYYVGLRRGRKAAKEEATEEEGKTKLSSGAKDAIREELSPVVESLKKQSDELDLRSHFAEFPDDRKLDKAIRKRMEAWPTVPIEEIVKTLKFGTEAAERATRRTATVTRTKGSALRGSSTRAEEPSLPQPGDFKEIYKKVKQGGKLDVESGKWS